MKRQTSLTISLVTGMVIACGWFLFGRTKAAAQATTNDSGFSACADLVRMQSFGRSFTTMVTTESVIEMLDSGRIEEAKHSLRLAQDGAILALDISVESTNLQPKEITALRDFVATAQPSSQSSMRESANRALARVARHRSDHPWIYKGNQTNVDMAEVDAKVASILKRASESQK
jgi:hypothetical protein